MRNKVIAVIGLTLIVSIVAAFVFGLLNEVQWEKKAQRHVMAQSLANIITNTSNATFVDSTSSGHYSAPFTIFAVGDSSTAVGIAQDKDRPEHAVVAWRSPRNDQVILKDLNLESEEADEELKTLTGNLWQALEFTRSDISSVSEHIAARSGLLAHEIYAARSGSKLIGAAWIRDSEEIVLILSDGNKIKMLSGNTSEHKPVALHRLEESQPIER